MTHDDIATLAAARSAARAAGMFIAEKSGRFLLIRKNQPRNVVVGTRGSAAGILDLVSSAVRTAPSRPA